MQLHSSPWLITCVGNRFLTESSPLWVSLLTTQCSPTLRAGVLVWGGSHSNLVSEDLNITGPHTAPVCWCQLFQ